MRDIKKSLFSLCTCSLAGLITSIALASPAQAISAHKKNRCEARQLEAYFDNRNGLLDGMSQRGTLLVLYNKGARACQLDALPALWFEGANGQRLPVERRAPRGMHPGPVLLPVTLAPGAEVATLLRWVSGAAYPGGNCLTPNTAVLELPEEVLRLPFGLPMCAAAGSSDFFNQLPLGRIPDELE